MVFVLLNVHSFIEFSVKSFINPQIVCFSCAIKVDDHIPNFCLLMSNNCHSTAKKNPKKEQQTKKSRGIFIRRGKERPNVSACHNMTPLSAEKEEAWTFFDILFFAAEIQEQPQ